MERAYKLNSEAENKFYDFHEDLYQAFQNEESENAQDILQPYLNRLMFEILLQLK